MSKMGVIQGGGQWPNRLLRRCGEIVGEVGEDVIYSMYVDSSESSHREVENPEEEYAVMFRYACHSEVRCQACQGVIAMATEITTAVNLALRKLSDEMLVCGVTQPFMPRGRPR